MIPAVFLHIQKTAGTTIVNLARKHYGTNNVMSHGDHYIGLYNASNPKNFFKPEDVRARHKEKMFISGHFGYDFCSLFMEKRFSFTFLREPMERVLSFYYFCKSRPPDEFPVYAMAQSNTLDDFLELAGETKAARGYVWNSQVWQLACGFCNTSCLSIDSFNHEQLSAMAISHIDKFSYVGTVEKFPASRDFVLQELGIALPRSNHRENATPGRPEVQDLPKRTLTLLRNLTQLEYPLYEAVASAQAGGKMRPSLRDLRRHIFSFFCK